MRNAVNIFNKINFRVICTLVAVLFVFSFVAPTEAADYSQLINRANELIVKNNLTTQELNELNSLISKAQQVPAEKRTSETKKLLQNYDQNKTKLDQRQAQLEYQDASDSIAQIEHVLKSGEVKDAATAMQLRNEITRLQQTQSSAQIRMDYDPCKNSCLPKCYYKALRECTLCGLFKIASTPRAKWPITLLTHSPWRCFTSGDYRLCNLDCHKNSGIRFIAGNQRLQRPGTKLAHAGIYCGQSS